MVGTPTLPPTVPLIAPKIYYSTYLKDLFIVMLGLNLSFFGRSKYWLCLVSVLNSFRLVSSYFNLVPTLKFLF